MGKASAGWAGPCKVEPYSMLPGKLKRRKAGHLLIQTAVTGTAARAVRRRAPTKSVPSAMDRADGCCACVVEPVRPNLGLDGRECVGEPERWDANERVVEQIPVPGPVRPFGRSVGFFDGLPDVFPDEAPHLERQAFDQGGNVFGYEPAALVVAVPDQR